MKELSDADRGGGNPKGAETRDFYLISALCFSEGGAATPVHGKIAEILAQKAFGIRLIR